MSNLEKKSWADRIVQGIIRVEIIVFIIIIPCFIGWFWSIRVTNMIMVIGFMLISVVAFLLMFIHQPKGEDKSSKRLKLASFVTNLGVAIGSLGVCFRLMLYPGSSILLTTSIFLLPISCIILVFIYGKIKYNYLIIKSFIALIIVFTAWQISSFSIFVMKHTDDPELVLLYVKMRENRNNKAFLKYVEDKYKVYLPLD